MLWLRFPLEGKVWRGRAVLLADSVIRRLLPSETTSQSAPAQASQAVDWTRGAPAAYLQTLSRYRLTPYPGRITLILTKDSDWSLNPESPWRKTASNLEIHWVSGDHTTALAVHAPETAGKMRDALARSSPERVQRHAQA